MHPAGHALARRAGFIVHDSLRHVTHGSELHEVKWRESKHLSGKLPLDWSALFD
jgi:hypothetical protein